MKLQAPDGVSGPIFHRGRAIELAADGSLDLPDDEAVFLIAHGFVRIGRAARELVETREAMVARATARARELAERLPLVDLQARLGESNASAPPEEGGGAMIDPGADAATIAAMNRAELFAFLRARGAPAPIPIRNEELRQRALAILTPTEARDGDAE